MLKGKLTKTLREQSKGWFDLANALNAISEKVIEPLLIRARSLSNLFEMNEADLNIRLDEMGSFMSFGQFDDVNKPLIIQQRTDEIHYKNTLYPLSKTLLREFGNKRVRWQRLYAPEDFTAHPYGSLFVTESGKQLHPEITKWIRVSRGVIESPIADFYEEAGGDIAKAEELIAQFQKSLDEVVIPLVPTHIVFDGQIFTIFVSIKEAYEIARLTASEITDQLERLREAKEAITTSNSVQAETYHLPNENPIIEHPSSYRMDCLDLDSCPLDAEHYFNRGLSA
ncbi:hypothetical protein [Vibrio sonorensis]|uniref:hypothetical protein n=1 Tax=Vibrio sonorensis TaxID=1004316 RepID=UPI0008D8F904|nr:hypothetical protein [Vibrio sonorensis]